MVIRREFALSVAALAVIALLAGAGPTSAAVLVDGNSSVEIDPASSSGVFSWSINGVNHLDCSWLWYGGQGISQEFPLDSVYNSLKSPNSGANWLEAYYGYPYQGGYVEITLYYILTGGPPGSGQSTLEGTMTLENASNVALDAKLFAYFDFDLNGTDDDETAERLGAQWMRQTDGNTVVDVLVDPAPSAWEIAESPAIYDKLTDGDADNLANTGSFASDAEFAWQWNATIPAKTR